MWQHRPKTETPAGFLQRGLRLTRGRAYSAQQVLCAMQRLPPLQQSSAVLEVALTEPTTATAARIIKRYFIRSPCLNLSSIPSRGEGDRRVSAPGRCSPSLRVASCEPARAAANRSRLPTPATHHDKLRVFVGIYRLIDRNRNLFSAPDVHLEELQSSAPSRM